MQSVGRRHGDLVVRHDDELRLSGKFLEHAHEAVDVGVVERGIDLVEDAERAGLDLVDGKEQGDGRQRPLAARQQADILQALAAGAGDDVDVGL